MEEHRGYYRAGNIFYRPSEAELYACAQACSVDREMIESVSPAHPEQQRRLEGHLTTGSYTETMVFESIQKLNRDQKDFLITAFEAVRFENYFLRTRLVQYEERVLQVILGDRAEWTEGADSSVYMGYNSVVRMNYGDPLFRYAFLEGEDKPTYFVWTINYSCIESRMRDMILDDLRAACSDFALFLGRLQHQQLTLPMRACDPCWAGLLARRQHKTSKMICPDSPDSPKFNPLEYTTLSGWEPLGVLHLPVQTPYIDVDLSVVGHAAWALAFFKGCTMPEMMFSSGDPISPGNLQGYTSLLSPILKDVQICIRVERNQQIRELLTQIDDYLNGRIVKEHGTTKASGMNTLLCRMVFRGSFQWDPVAGEKSFAIFDPKVLPAIFECKQGTPPSHDYGVQLDIQKIGDFIMIQSAWDTLWGQAQVDTVFESFVYFFEAIVKGWGGTVGDLLAGYWPETHPRCGIPYFGTLDGSLGCF